ncbi:MAG TPA: thermonuclease family protein [Candidatus Brocadiales bacterium]|nr:thermonuclease family protein [Candidatus Brocadiales bacterium]
MKFFLRPYCAIWAIILLSAACSKNVTIPTYKCIEVIDGDTIILKGVGKVRLIGVNAPEIKDRHRGVQRFGMESTIFTEQNLLGKQVRLEYDEMKVDKFGRTLAYVYVDDTLFNAELVKQGYALVYAKYPFKYLDEFRRLEMDAKKNGRGLWSYKR